MNKQFYRIANIHMPHIIYSYGDEIEVIEKEHAYTLVKLTEDQYQSLTTVEIDIVRC